MVFTISVTIQWLHVKSPCDIRPPGVQWITPLANLLWIQGERPQTTGERPDHAENGGSERHEGAKTEQPKTPDLYLTDLLWFLYLLNCATYC